MLPNASVRQQITFSDAKRAETAGAAQPCLMATAGACVSSTRPASVYSAGVPRLRHLGDGDLLCGDLPTAFQPHIGGVLVTGATGYVGGRLVPELLARWYRVRAMVRTDAPKHRASCDVVCRDDAIRRLIPFEPLSYSEAIARAMEREEQNRPHTLWSQSGPASTARLRVARDERGRKENRRHWWVINRGGLMGPRTAHEAAGKVNHVAVAS